MSRVQLALNVSDLDAAIAFYSKVFNTEPAKVRDGYANFAIAEPPLKLVLFSGAGEPGTLNHLGVEVESTDDVQAATERFQALGLPTQVQEQTACCYAVQDKVWISGADTMWEFYTVLADSPVLTPAPSSCCASDSVGVPVSLGAASPSVAPAASTSACC